MTDAGGGLVEELQKLARAKSTTELNPQELPKLHARTEGSAGGWSIEAIEDLLFEAATSLNEPDRRAIEEIFGGEELRWTRTLTSRMTRAGGELGYGYDAFRRRSGGQPSHFDRLIGRLAEALGDTSVSHDELAPARPARPRHLLVLGGAVVVGAIAVIVALITRSGEGAEPRTASAQLSSIEGCDIPLAASLNPPAVPDAVIALITSGFADSGGQAVIGCPRAAARNDGPFWHQDFDNNGGPTLTIVAVDTEDRAVTMDRSLLEAYTRIADGTPVETAGTPLTARIDNGFPILELTGGGVVVANFPGGPAHWIPTEAIDTWTNAGGLTGPIGPPMADVNFLDGRLQQHFAGGLLRLADNGTVEATLADPQEIEELQEQTVTQPGILRLYDGTAWWIDDTGTRTWIPDADTWFCLGGDDAVLDQQAPGWLVASYPHDGAAVCDSN